MKKTTKKSVTQEKSTQPTILRVESTLTAQEGNSTKLPSHQRDSRLPVPGSILTKTYHGQTIEVQVLENGFEYDGKVFKSISRVAMTIVKRPISGYVFFGLNK